MFPPPASIVTLLRHAIANPSVRSIRQLVDELGASEKSIARTCRAAAVPHPKAWLFLADAVKTTFLLNLEPARSSADLAEVLGYPDKFTYLRALRRSTGVGIENFRVRASTEFAVRSWCEKQARVVYAASTSAENKVVPIGLQQGG